MNCEQDQRGCPDLLSELLGVVKNNTFDMGLCENLAKLVTQHQAGYVEDCATKQVELFAVTPATATLCATTFEEVILWHGLPRRISDNGSQFASTVMQQRIFSRVSTEA